MVVDDDDDDDEELGEDEVLALLDDEDDDDVDEAGEEIFSLENFKSSLVLLSVSLVEEGGFFAESSVCFK